MHKFLLFLMASLLFASQAIAIDDEYNIPYTDTYGYIYDPETGQYVKQEKSTPQSQASAGQPANTGSDSRETISQVAAGTDSSSEEAAPPRLMMAMGGGILVLAVIGAVFFFSRQKKKGATVT